MSLLKQTIFLFLLALTATLTASAQDRSVVFTLKQAASWGAADLPAGQYRVTFLSAPVTKAVIAAEDGKNLAIVIPVSRDYNYSCDYTALTLAPTSGSYAVTRVCFSDTKLAYYFESRAAKRENLAQAQSFAGSK
jgi:hypothetical protein